ncbi:MAG: hypothetical protein ABIJ81_01560 [Patescibacteria group bacterium]
MNFIIVTLNKGSIQLLKKPQDKHHIQIVQSCEKAIEILDRIVKKNKADDPGIRDYILLTEYSIPHDQGQLPDPYNSITLAMSAAHRHIGNVIIGLEKPSLPYINLKIEHLDKTSNKKGESWYVTKQIIKTNDSELETNIYYVQLPTTTKGVDEILLKPVAYDWPAIIALLEKKLKIG